jgi:hypothetical protein
MSLFKSLTPEEESQYRTWAINHYAPFDDIKGTWHPTIQAECVEINRRHGTTPEQRLVSLAALAVEEINPDELEQYVKNHPQAR